MEDQKNEIMGILEKYGNPRLAIPSLPLLEELTNGLLMDAIDNQRMLIISAIDEWTSSSSNLSIQSEIIGFNGIMLRHQQPEKVTVSATVRTLSNNINAKGFVSGILRYPSRDSRNYHFTELWTPPSPGVYTIVAIGEDSSGNVVMSSPVTLTSTFGIDPPQVRMTSPSSGTQRSVQMVGQHAEGQAVHDWEIYWWETGSAGEIEGITLTNRGSGYVAPPTVHFIGSGYGAQATATIVTDPANPRFGQIDQITLNSKGQGYFGETIVELRGGLGNESLFLNAQAYDIDGEVNQIEFLSNGQLVASDLTEPFAIQETFSVGYYEFIALAKDDAGNIVASEPSRVNVSTIRGAAPSGFIIYPLPIIALQSYQTMGQDYFWPFVRNYSELILQQESTLGNQVESFSLASNSFIHLSARATDSDGSIKDVTFYLNNKYLGKAERYHDSHHYFLPVDLSDFGEQPVYRIDTMIRDQADNVVIPNNPIYLNVLSATGSRPDIEIVMPSPNANTIPKFSMGGQVSLVVDATPKEGTLAPSFPFRQWSFYWGCKFTKYC